MKKTYKYIISKMILKNFMKKNFTIILFIIINSIIKTSSNINKVNNNQRNLDSYNQYIKLQINKTGKINIFGASNFKNSEVYFNGQKIESEMVYLGRDYEIFINITSLSNNNEILIKLNNKFSTTGKMFRGCDSLISIDLSNFDTSSVTNMRGMFAGCNSLISLNLSNFNTSKVTTMDEKF